jgi:ribosomal protein S15P/S13E
VTSEMNYYKQALAVHYAVLYLEGEIKEVSSYLESVKSETVKRVLTNRLNELKKHLEEFDKINN